MIGDFLEVYDFDYLMEMALSNVDNSFDKRQGSIIYDALAPACSVLADAYTQIRQVYNDTYASSATGEYLDLKVADMGITRYPATSAYKRIDILDEDGNALSVPIGSRFSTVSDYTPLSYAITEVYTQDGVTVPGAYVCSCEDLGTQGNGYTGEMINISNINNIGTATLSTLITPARDAETDSELRSRYYEKMNKKPFGGNVAQYNGMLKAISGVGECQIYPVWNGGGTVKCSIVDSNYRAVSAEFISQVKETLDPTDYTGMGVGEVAIDHSVTVVTPSEITVNVSAVITLNPSYTISSVLDSVKTNVESYISSLRQDWGKETTMNTYNLEVYNSRVIYAILNTTGVVNVSSVTLNGSSSDIILTQNSTTQQIPVLGEVTLSES